MLFLDGPGGPALARGWQKFTSVPSRGAAAQHWYVCTGAGAGADKAVWDPPYAPIPSAQQLAAGAAPLPYHPRINGSEKYVADAGGARHYFDPRSGQLLAAGWRSVTDGVEVWFGNAEEGKSTWEAPLYKLGS